MKSSAKKPEMTDNYFMELCDGARNGRDLEEEIYCYIEFLQEELQRKNPKLPNGHRRWKHHQWLTEDIGDPSLRQHLASVITLMKISPNWPKFKRHVERALPKLGAQLPLIGVGDDDEV